MTWKEFVAELLEYFAEQIPFSSTNEKTLKQLAIETTHGEEGSVMKFHAEDVVYAHLMLVLKEAYKEVLTSIYGINDGAVPGNNYINTSEQKDIVGMAMLFSSLYHDSAKWFFRKVKNNSSGKKIVSFKGHHFGGAALAREAMLSAYWQDIFFSKLNMSNTEYSALYELVQLIIQTHQAHDLKKEVKNSIESLNISTDNFDGELVSAVITAFNLLDREGSFNLDSTFSGLVPSITPKFDEERAEPAPLSITTSLFNNVGYIVGDVIRDIEYWNFDVILLQGISGSGKSYIANVLKKEIEDKINRNVSVVSYDTIRLLMYRRANGINAEGSIEEYSAEEYAAAHEFVHSDNEHLEEMNRVASKQVSSALKAGNIVIIDNTNINSKSRRRSLQAIGNKRRVLALVIDSPPWHAEMGNVNRGKEGKKVVDKEVIIKQHMWYSWPLELIGRERVRVGKDEFLEVLSKIRVYVKLNGNNGRVGGGHH